MKSSLHCKEAFILSNQYTGIFFRYAPQFYKTYPIVHTLRGQLSWSHYGLLIRIKENEKREFYELQTLQNLWSIRELEKQIKSGLYERMIKKPVEMVL